MSSTIFVASLQEERSPFLGVRLTKNSNVMDNLHKPDSARSCFLLMINGGGVLHSLPPLPSPEITVGSCWFRVCEPRLQSNIRVAWLQSCCGREALALRIYLLSEDIVFEPGVFTSCASTPRAMHSSAVADVFKVCTCATPED